MKMDYETLKLERIEDHLLLVTLNRPDAANALNTQMGYDFRDLWTHLYMDQEDLRCIVVTGSGDRIFCAGGDPIIAAVNGAAVAGGLEFVLGSDFAYGASHAKFALTEVTLGIMPGAMGTQNLPRAVGVRRAKEIILTGKMFTAQEALEWGVLNRICADGKLMEETLETARAICNNAPISTRQAKKSLNVSTQIDLKNGYAFEIEAYNRMVTTEDRLEGVRAFNEKRKAQFKGH